MPTQRLAITDRESWLAKRNSYITASEIAALYGMHPFLTVAELYAQKQGAMPPKKDDTLIRRGRRMEDVAAAEVKEKRPQWLITKANEFIFDDTLRIGATPDFYVNATPDGIMVGTDKLYFGGRRGVLDTKIVTPRVFEHDWAEGFPPLHIILQVQTQMLLDDCLFGVVGALVVGDYEFDIHIFEIPRHPRAEQKLISLVADFWKNFDERKVPEFDFERDRAVIHALYPSQIVGKHLDLSHDNRMFELLSEKNRLQTELDIINTRITKTDNEIKAKMGDAESAQCGQWNVTYKSQHRKEYTVKATDYRVLRFR